MFSEEIKQVVYLSVTCVLLAMVLTFASSLMTVKNNMVDTRNVEINTGAQIKEAKQFAKYNDTTLTGIDVIEAISEYKTDDNILVIVKVRQGSRYPRLFSKKNFQYVAQYYEIDRLQNLFTGTGADEKYHAKLITGLPGEVNEKGIAIPGTLGTEIIKYMDGRTSTLDDYAYSADGNTIKAILFYPV